MYFRILLIIIPYLLSIFRSDNTGEPAERFYRVIKVVDGDTFWIDNGAGKAVKVRLIGVDAPESAKTAVKEAGYYSREASGYLSGLIGGRKVKLSFDADRYDRYGRTLAYVFLEDGTFVNAELVKNGYAKVLTVPPNVKYADTFRRLERKARSQKRGMWGK